MEARAVGLNHGIAWGAGGGQEQLCFSRGVIRQAWPEVLR